MKLHIILAVIEGCDRDRLDEVDTMRRLLQRMVRAADFTLFDVRIHRYAPQGVTAAAIVGESHIALHTWPEEGALFLDIASCTSLEAAERALASVEQTFGGTRVRRSTTSYDTAHGFQRSRDDEGK